MVSFEITVIGFKIYAISITSTDIRWYYMYVSFEICVEIQLHLYLFMFTLSTGTASGRLLKYE